MKLTKQNSNGRDDMRVTMKNINSILKPHGLEFIKGNGYFYFMELDGCKVDTIPESILVYALNQQTWKQWESDMEDAIQQSKGEMR